MKKHQFNEHLALEFEIHEDSTGRRKPRYRLLRDGKPTPSDRWNYPYGRQVIRRSGTLEELELKAWEIFLTKIIPRFTATPQFRALLV